MAGLRSIFPMAIVPVRLHAEVRSYPDDEVLKLSSDNEDNEHQVFMIAPKDPKMFKRPIMDSGAVGSVCPRGYASEQGEPVDDGEKKNLRSVTGGTTEYYGKKKVEVKCTTAEGRRLPVGGRILQWVHVKV